MRVLLVNPEFPNSYWSGKYSLPFSRRKSLLPPLGLITIAAMLPRDWECRLVDLNQDSLPDADLQNADLVMLTGMLVQRPSLHEVLARCRRLGVKTVVGGPYATALPQELEGADHVVVGEAEEIMADLTRDLAAGTAGHLYREKGKPDVARSPLPRYDLLKVESYHQLCLQYSRGCPFSCEFCDIIVMYGQKPRTKTAGQVIRELEAIQSTGFRGDVFFVDDNFIGNKRAVKEMLPELAEWRNRTRASLEFYTEASMNIADDTRLVNMMTHAGFTAVFIGIESPSPEALRETRKLQNLKRNMVEQVHFLKEKGLDVWAGFILGFDCDGPDSFDNMIRFIEDAAIPYAMVGMLSALPNTPLYKRLEKEGRLRPDTVGDQFGLSNVITKLPASQMVAGYRRVLETLYQPENFFQRCRENIARWKAAPGSRRPIFGRDLLSALRAMRGQGIASPYRKDYWKFLGWVLKNYPEKIGKALATAAAGHHYITYTRKVVVPDLKKKAASLATLPQAASIAGVEPVLSG